MTILCSDYRRIIVGLSSNRLSIGGSIQGVSAEILRFKITWQAQYLVRLPARNHYPNRQRLLESVPG